MRPGADPVFYKEGRGGFTYIFRCELKGMPTRFQKWALAGSPPPLLPPKYAC